MKKPRFVFVLLLIIMAKCCFADTGKLKNGRVLGGTLKEINETDVVLDVQLGSSAGTVWFGKKEVESINGLSIEELSAKPATQNISNSNKVSSLEKELVDFLVQRKPTPEEDASEDNLIIEITAEGREKPNAYAPNSILFYLSLIKA